MSGVQTSFRKRLYDIIEIGYAGDSLSRGYDLFSTFLVLLNLTCSILGTFEPVRLAVGPGLELVESLTAVFFAADYILRVWTACYLYRDKSDAEASFAYIRSFTGIIDLLSFLPFFLPVFFPDGAVAFRMFRVIRVLRLFRINTYYDSLNVISEVLKSKRQQLISSVFIILILMIAASLCMYSIENQAQPDVFRNAFSGIWWAASTLLTVGYGDIYPVTTMGRVFSIFITFLGVGMVAIPTGIISAGFVEQYTRLKQLSEQASEEQLRFLKVRISEKDRWCGQMIGDLGLPEGMIAAVVIREGEALVPKGDLQLLSGDVVVLGAVDAADIGQVTLKELTLKKKSEWNGMLVRDLSISRQTLIVMVRRGNKEMIPKGDFRLLEGDRVMLFTKLHRPGGEQVII